MTGPPSETPQRLSGSIGATGRPSTELPRRPLSEYSKKPPPWNSLVPDRVTTLIAQPARDQNPMQLAQRLGWRGHMLDGVDGCHGPETIGAEGDRRPSAQSHEGQGGVALLRAAHEGQRDVRPHGAVAGAGENGRQIAHAAAVVQRCAAERLLMLLERAQHRAIFRPPAGLFQPLQIARRLIVEVVALFVDGHVHGCLDYTAAGAWRQSQKRLGLTRV